MPDVSLVLALHREAHYVARTLKSLAEAAIYARAVGISTELVAVLDRSDAATESALGEVDVDAFERVQILRVDNGSLGPTRNDGCNAATGTYIATADGDDLISYNYIERMTLLADELGQLTILVPKFVFAFGENYHLAEYFDLDQVTPLAMMQDHPFLSRVFFHRSLCDYLIYQDVSLTKGYAYEDWHFNCNAIALGYKFFATEETILFYRQRRGGLLSQGNRISVRQMPPSLLFQPQYYRRVCEPWVTKFETDGDFRSDVPFDGKEFLGTRECLELMVAANAIEPAIEPSRLLSSPYFNYLNANISTGAAYYRLCQIVENEQFDEVFLLPFLTTGGGDRYVLDVILELSTLDPGRRILILFGEPFDRYAWLDRLPAQCVYIDLCAACPELNADERDLLCLKLIQACAANARLHLRSSTFGQRFFARFAPVLAALRPVYYRFSDGRNTFGDVTLVEPSAFHFVAEHVEVLDKIVCDNSRIIAADLRRLRYMEQKWHLLYSKMDVHGRLPKLTQAGANILWASRLDSEKRPELLIKIAQELAKRMPKTIIDVFGRPTLDEFDVTRLKAMSNVRYRGYYERFDDIEINSYHCFVYTSRFDGMPVILLEMIAAGLPIIAPDVGGIGELIQNRETGLLLECTGDDTADAEIYVTAIEELFADPDLHQRIRIRAWELVVERHGLRRYAECVSKIFDIAPVRPKDHTNTLSKLDTV